MNFINNTACRSLITLSNNFSQNGLTTGIKSMLNSNEVTYIIVGFGIFAGFLAIVFSQIRIKVYGDKNSLDLAFNAGGKVNAGLTATTIVSQWTWAATLLQSSTVATKYGISGPFWYAAGATIQILLFSILSVQLKIRAPGAKTFLQVIKARFGSRTHKVFCVFALMTNIIVTAMLMLGGAAVMTSVTNDISVEYATVLVTAVIGAYTLIGGLGATFYVSYFNTAIIYVMLLVFVMKVYNDPDSEDNKLGTIERVFEFLECSKGPANNEASSYLTILSPPGLMFGIINIVGNFGTVFVDQSYWQSSVAAKPKQGVIGFLTGGLCWFAIPFGLASTVGLAYIALSTSQNSELLSESDINSGLVPVVVAQKLMGRTGEFLIITMVLMAVTSTGSAEVMAVTSILVYDVYQLYLKPYRLVTDANSCILCGRSRGRMANPRDKCKCESMTFCQDCMTDDRDRKACRKALKPPYKCKTHGSFREYNEYLSGLKNWCMMWTILSIVPLTVILNLLGLSLGWVYNFMGILIGSSVIPIALCMSWERLTGDGMIAGSVSGMILALITWLSVAATNEGGLTAENFFLNTANENAMFAGNLVAILSGGAITILVSFFTSCKQVNSSDIWENTRDIDNPLSPWAELYAKDLNLTSAHIIDNRPSYEDVSKAFKGARRCAYFGAAITSFVLILLWPSLMIAEGVMDVSAFRRWVLVSIIWSVIAAAFIIIVPVVYEVIDLHGAVQRMRSVHPISWTSNRYGGGAQDKVTKPSESRRRTNEKNHDVSHFTLEEKTNGRVEEKLSNSFVEGYADPCHVETNTESDTHFNHRNGI